MAEPVHKRSKSDDESEGGMDSESDSTIEIVLSDNEDVGYTITESTTHIVLTCPNSDRNMVTAIGKCLHLQTLTVCRCILQDETFGTELQKCVKLRSLWISRQECRHPGILRDANLFLHSMENNAELLSVNFCDINIQGISLVGFLRKCPKLIIVQVDSCIMNIDGGISFKNCFSASLTRLVFKHNNFGDQGAIALAAGLPQCVKLVFLDLTQNNIGDAGALELTITLPKSLEQLTLTGNKITGFFSFLPLPENLRELKLDRNNFGDRGAIALAASLPQCGNLVFLDLTQNNIGDAGALELIRTLPESLKQLTLTDNKITGLNFLPLPKNLRELNLDHNKISDVGIFNVVSASQPFSGLQLLDLSNNCITEDGIIASVSMLPLCYDLRFLNLSNNPIKDHGAIALAQVLPGCKNLGELSLNCTNITNTGVSAFIKVVIRCGKLTKINLYGNDISDLVFNKLRSSFLKQPYRYAMVATSVPTETNWNRSRHNTFGKKINEVFAAFLLGLTTAITEDNSVVPDADPEMIEETLEALHYYGLTVTNFSSIIAAGNVAINSRSVKRR